MLNKKYVSAFRQKSGLSNPIKKIKCRSGFQTAKLSIPLYPPSPRGNCSGAIYRTKSNIGG